MKKTSGEILIPLVFCRAALTVCLFGLIPGCLELSVRDRLVATAQQNERATSVAGQPPAIEKSDQSQTQQLLPYRQLEREITTETHNYQIEAKSGHYLRILFEAWGLNLTIEIQDPSGQLQTRSYSFPDEPTPVSFIAKADGTYEVQIRATAPQTGTGRYAILIDEIRKQASGDDERVLAEQALTSAEQLRADYKIPSYEKAIQQYQQAKAHAQMANDRMLEEVAVKNIGEVYESLNRNSNALAY